MERGHLSEYFDAVAAKTLSQVETDPGSSNQHEFDGVAPFKNILGLERLTAVPTSFVYLSDEEPPSSATGFMTWYDARERHSTRSEHRLYYPTNSVMEKASPSDLMLLCRKRDGGFVVVIAKHESSAESQVRWLFGLGTGEIARTISRSMHAGKDRGISLVSSFILEEIGISTESKWTDNGLLDCILERFGKVFPPTRHFSALARELTGQAASSAADPDGAVMAWMEMEEAMFRTLERDIVRQRIDEGFHGDVDAFLSFSLGVHNRRKSRVGYALENHLEQVFKDRQIPYTRGGRTERRAKPDFLFPGVEAYHDPAFPAAELYMLGAKSTCKDRWRQILPEAARIREKHLATLEPGISPHQTAEMEANHVRLVIPHPVHEAYTVAQRGNLLSLEAFLREIAVRAEPRNECGN